MAYNCYLDGVLMPQTPAALSLKIKGKNATLTLLNEGEINFLKLPGLTEIKFTLVFPMLEAKHPPTYYLALLEKLKNEKQPTQFILTRSTPDGKLLFDTNIKVSLEDYETQESASDGFDITVDVKLLQYRDYGTKTIKLQMTTKTAAAKTSGGTSNPAAASNSKIAAADKVMIQSGAVYGGLSTDRGKKVPAFCIGKWYTVSQTATHKGNEEALLKEIFSWVAFKYLQKEGSTTTTATVQTERSSNTAPKASTHTIQAGDTLWAIAAKYLGSGARYTEIVDANPDKISNPNSIKVGTVIKIP